jgi:hypothetical protein
VVEGIAATDGLVTTLVKVAEVVQPFFLRQLAAVVITKQG